MSMARVILEYFSGEKLESIVFLIWGIGAILVSLFLWFTGSQYKAMLYPLTALAIIQITVGGTVYFRTDAQVQTLSERMRSAPMDFRSEELARMKTVSERFKLYKFIEISLLVVGIAISYLWRDNVTGNAIAIGLIIQSTMLLVADLIAEYRAYEYVVKLQQFFPNFVQA
jgi:hypothetical protein